MSTALTNMEPLETAFIKALGLDRVPAEQRELAIAIAKRYDLDLMLKHLILVEGRPYITRDGLLHVAHRSGVFDGIEVSDPVLEGGYWHVRATVYRKDMTRGFTYPGRYPEKGRNAAFGPEMATKVAEVMALRRAFDVSAPVAEERWDLDAETTEAPAPRPVASLSDKVASRRAAIEARANDEPDTGPATEVAAASGGAAPSVPDEPDVPPAVAVGGGEAAAIAPAPSPSPDPDVRPCGRLDPVGEEACVLPMGHEGRHEGKVGKWA